VQLFTGPNPVKGRPAFDDFGFSKECIKARVMFFPLNHMGNLKMFAKSTVEPIKVIALCA